ncbi:MAG: hypothetical protein ACKVS9_06900 [Phycisphaerae bacterium]
MRAAAEGANSAGHFGKVICVADENNIIEVTPLEIPFEPLPLNVHEPRFVEYYQMAVRGERFENLDERVRPQSEFGHVRRFFEANPAAVAVGAIGLVVVWTLFRRGGATVTSMLSAAGLCMHLFLVLWLQRTGNDVFLVPRGVVVRGSARNKAAFALIERDESVLIAARETGKQWRVALASEAEVFEFRCERCEVELLLAAWLSPLPAPDEQTVAGLT